MITTVTGKNQVSIPAEVAQRHGITPGCRLEWLPGKDDVSLEVIIHPDPSSVAASLMGKGRRHLRRRRSAVGDLLQGRKTEEADRT